MRETAYPVTNGDTEVSKYTDEEQRYVGLAGQKVIERRSKSPSDKECVQNVEIQLSFSSIKLGIMSIGYQIHKDFLVVY